MATSIKDVKDAVIALGFSDYIESEPRFLSALNLGIQKLAAVFPKTYLALIPVFPLKNTIQEDTGKSFRIKGSRTFFGADARSFCFSFVGRGSVKISFFNSSPSVNAFEVLEERVLSSDTVSVERGFLKKSGAFQSGSFKIEFTENGYLVVSNIALYGENQSDEQSDIPQLSKQPAYLIDDYIEESDKAEVSAFRCLSRLPEIESDGVRYPVGFTLTDGKITFDGGAEGTVYVYYHAEPKLTTSDSLDTDKLPLSGSVSGILPLIVASFYYLDEDEEKSRYYYSLYLEEEARLKTVLRGANSMQIYNLSRWS